jgi:hypothetical protein
VRARLAAPVDAARRLARAAVGRGMPAAWAGYRWVKRDTIPEYFGRERRRPGERWETVHPPTVQSGPLPFNVRSRTDLPDERNWWGFSFRSAPDRESAATHVATLADCRVVPDVNPEGEFHPAVLTASGRSLELREITFRPWHGARLRAGRPPQVARRATWVTERVYHNHAHWLTGPLPKLVWLRDQDRLDDVLLPTDRAPAVDASLRALGLDPRSFATFETGRTVRVGALTVIDNDRLGRDMLGLAHGAFLASATEAPRRRVYVSRAEASYRTLVNEEGVWSVLRRAGFERVSMEALSFDEQVRLMQETAVLVGPHGAGLANMLFLHRGAVVVEIASADYPSPDFNAMANSLGLRYGVVFAEGVGDRPPPWRDIRVAPALVEDVLSHLPCP